MLETIALILIVLWLLGLVSSYTIGGFIHILLVLAVVVILLRLIRGRRARGITADMVEPLASRRFLIVLMVIATGLLALLIWPFAASFFSAAVVAAVLHSRHQRLTAALRNRRYVASGLLTAGIVLVVVVPVTTLSILVVQQGLDLRTWITDTADEKGIEGLLEPLPELIQKPVRWVIERIPENFRSSGWFSPAEPNAAPSEAAASPPPEDKPDPRGSGVLKAAAGAASVVTRVLAGLLHVLVSVGLFILALYLLLAEGKRLLDYLIDLLPMPEEKSREMFSTFREITVAVLFSTIVTALVQTAAALIGYLIAGIPALALMLFLTFLMAFIPAIGAAGVVAATGIVLCLSERIGMGIFLLAWGFLAVGLVDNLLKPLMVGGRTTLPAGIVFFAMICGLTLLGPMGLVAGPLIVAFFASVAKILRDARLATPPSSSGP